MFETFEELIKRNIQVEKWQVLFRSRDWNLKEDVEEKNCKEWKREKERERIEEGDLLCGVETRFNNDLTSIECYFEFDSQIEKSERKKASLSMQFYYSNNSKMNIEK